MVRAILEGRKTQTRRVVKFDRAGRVKRGQYSWHIEDGNAYRACPYGSPGVRLWVRETLSCTYAHGSWYTADADMLVIKDQRAYELAARYGSHYFENEEKRIPSIHMPRWASRITLKITDVRVERLQEINPDDCEAEGIKQRWTCINPAIGSYAHDNDVQDDYRKLWTSINGAESWAANPWVWVVSFERVSP
jgi:hypothetical protein